MNETTSTISTINTNQDEGYVKRNKYDTNITANRIKLSEYLAFDFNKTLKELGINDSVCTWQDYRELLYSPSTGNFYKYFVRLNKETNEYYISAVYRVFHSPEYKINVLRNSTNKRTFKNPNVLAWEIMNKRRIPKDCIVFPRDLNRENLKGDNIGFALRAEYRTILDELANFNGALRITILGNHKFKVYFREGGFKQSRIFHDEDVAKEFFRNCKIRCHKLLSKFHINR